ncbi:MAG: helix-turn-helix transcriptional regulator [Erysipelotrichaceae bacterium]|nr:helix-turn-helix transcriptional regulator [Erysipelotrichaceae bacterium]
MNSLPNKLLTLRKHYNFSQGFVAKNVGMDIFSYMAVENGRMMADYEQLRKIAAFYHLDIAELIDNRKEVTLKEYNKHYDTDKIDLTMIGKELKPKKTLKDILGSSYFFAFIVALIFMVVIVHYLPKNANHSLEQIYSPIDQLSASDTSVVYLYGNQLLSRGDNSNGQLDYAQIDNVLKA